jgi:hypothetical protein
MPETVPRKGEQDDATAVAELERTIERFRDYSGPLHPSPLFGAMDRETVDQLQLRHCAHHLGFLVPENP